MCNLKINIIVKYLDQTAEYFRVCLDNHRFMLNIPFKLVLSGKQTDLTQ
uniref:Uncharacterized protein n=1 Tax=Anguilla anguilla TaxID=7936 RepID=A0A0E9SJP4_ANGAN